MGVAQSSTGLQLPSSLETQLHDFRRRVWTIKSIEAACGALFGILVSYLIVFGLDRVIVDKNAHIGDGASLTNEAGTQEADGEGYYIREGIIIVPKGATVPPGTKV